MLERKRTRLKEFDYSSSNYYFITICTQNKTSLFGNVNNETLLLNGIGEIVKKCWLEIKEHFTNIDLDEFVIMPNHFHGIIIIDGIVGLRSPQPDAITKQFSLSQIVAYFKYQSTRKVNEQRPAANGKVWQRSFYDRIIRNEKELYMIRNYIRYNASKWNDVLGEENLEL